MEVLLCVRRLCVSRWTEIQCVPVFSGNFTPSGSSVKVTSNHRVAKVEGFTFVVRLWPSVIYICLVVLSPPEKYCNQWILLLKQSRMLKMLA